MYNNSTPNTKAMLSACEETSFITHLINKIDQEGYIEVRGDEFVPNFDLNLFTLGTRKNLLSFSSRLKDISRTYPLGEDSFLRVSQSIEEAVYHV